MLLAVLAIVLGLIMLVWSANRFVTGAAAAAYHTGMRPLLIGMFVVSFGSSIPELIVSTLAALEGSPTLALGNAYGSNIFNITLVVGLSVALAAITAHSTIVRKELPILIAVTFLAGLQLLDGQLSRVDALVLLLVFVGVVLWSILNARYQTTNVWWIELEQAIKKPKQPRLSSHQARVWLTTGLLLLILGSQLFVWGAVQVAQVLDVSELIMGLTIVAAGTSLPELATVVAAVRKGEDELALGNVVGANIFNTLAVVGIAGLIQPITIAPEVLYRDWLLMLGVTVGLYMMCLCYKRPGHLPRWGGGLLLLVFIIYNSWLLISSIHY